MPNPTQQQQPELRRRSRHFARCCRSWGWRDARPGTPESLGGGAARPSKHLDQSTRDGRPCTQSNPRRGETPVELVEHDAVAGGGTGGGIQHEKPSYAPKRVNEEQQGTIHINVRKKSSYQRLVAVGSRVRCDT